MHLNIYRLRFAVPYLIINFTFTLNFNRRKVLSFIDFIVSSKPVEMSEETINMVRNLIASDKIVIFSKSYCPYCKMAKEVFDKLNQKYTAVELDEREDADTIQSVLGDITGARTVPRVFVDGDCLGGGSDVKALYDSGKLTTIVSKK